MEEIKKEGKISKKNKSFESTNLFKKPRIKIIKKDRSKCVLNQTEENLGVIDLSCGLEETEIIFFKKNLAKLYRSNYNHKNDYVNKSFLISGNIKEYSLTKDYKCDCGNECDISNCNCINDHAQRYECNSNCSCSWSCKNRKVQKGISLRLKVDYINRKKGFGVFTMQDIEKDEFVCEYVGKIISKEMAEQKIKINHIRKFPNYVLQIRENYETMTINTFIDAQEKGNVSRFLNHSCKPNLYFDIVRIENFIPGVAFFASRDIKKGEELTFSYGQNNPELYQYSYKECYCKQDNCQKYLPS